MKTIKLFLAVSLLLSLSTNAQITKGNWMVGGSADFTYNKSSDGVKSKILNLNPNFGYFFLDKLSAGTLLNYYSSKSYYNNGWGKSETISLGPFIRYYLLEKEKKVNIFIETSYYFSLKKEDKSTSFSTKVGTAIFLNSSVAFETSLKYTKRNVKYYNNLLPNSHTDGFTLGIGLQIHLEKEK